MGASTRECPGGEQLRRYSSVTVCRGVCLTRLERHKYKRQSTPSRRCLRISATSSRSWRCFLRMWRCLTTFPIGRQVSQRGRCAPSLSELRLPTTIVPRVRRYRGHRECLRHVYGSNERRQGPAHPCPNYLGLHHTKRAVEDCGRPLLCYTPGALRNGARACGRPEMCHDYQ